MFDRFIRLARAKKALGDERFEDALQLALDPLIRSDRRAEVVRQQASERLLARAQARLDGGDVAAARVLAERVQQLVGGERAAAVLAAADAARGAAATAQQAAAQALAAARAALDRGEPLQADALLRSHGAIAAADRAAFERLLADRRRDAAGRVATAARAFERGALDEALAALAGALLIARDEPEVVALRARVAAEGGVHLAARCRTALDAGDVASVFTTCRQALAVVPEWRDGAALRAVTTRLSEVLTAHLAAAPTLEAAAAVARPAVGTALDLPASLRAVLEALAALPAGEGAVVLAEPPLAAVRCVAEGAGAAGLPGLEARAQLRLQQAAADAEQLAAARACVDRGDLDGARALLTALVAARPLHEGARRELELLDQGLADLERRLAEARTALRGGRLRTACTLALTLTGHARIAAEAQQLVVQARASMALVDRGLDEVRVALHGRTTATQEGLRHCILRLEELGKVQGDHADLPALVASVQAEIEALGACERLAGALDRAAFADVLQGFTDLLALRPKLLAAARLDARICDLADRCARATDVALAAGRLAEVVRTAELFDALHVVRPDYATRAASWREAQAPRRAAAAAMVAAGREALAQRDLAEAERQLEEARRQWAECDDARALSAALRDVRQQVAALERAADLARERDFAGAQQKLAAMPAPSPFLRTRIYDMKQDLARAQGLEGAFLLRVDEGGEQLVVRGETVSIGNVRQARADLPVLANLAGRHASIRRSMSFHGGMQDTVVAEEGEVKVGGRLVPKQALAHGDKVQLGPALGFVYQRPTSRSLTVGLVLQSGFQVAGTDRVLLMKDRGRDGRILLGPGTDVHVRVARASGEVELFATATGQIRVACTQGGTIDGVPFQGEHPVAAGQRIEAAGIACELLPWRPTA